MTGLRDRAAVAPDQPAAGDEGLGPGRPLLRYLGAAAVALVVLAGVGLRFWARSDLWLDEALSVNISVLPPGELLDALRRDGHPPLYYLLLNGWTRLVGQSDTAVRALSGVFSVATLPLAWIAGRRLAGRPGAVAALLLLATSPFAIRYATETRMYSLVTLLVFAGWLLLRRALEQPTLARLAPLPIVSGLLLLSHYWAFYLLGAVGLVLLWRAWKGPGERAARQAAIAVALGGLLFLPWLGGFLHQAQHTGTPWATPSRPAAIIMTTLDDYGGARTGEARFLGLTLAVLVMLGALGRAVDRRRVELDLRSRPEARYDLIVLGITLAVATVAGFATGAGFASRYTSIILPLVLLLAALGVTRLTAPALRATVLSVVAVIGLVGGVDNAVTNRTQGGMIGRTIAAAAAPGDAVVFCPDQLGPSVERHLPDHVDAFTHPELAAPERVDWVDYAERSAAVTTEGFAAAALERAGDGDLWYVWQGGYRTLGERCEELVDSFTAARGSELVERPEEYFERAWLFRFPAPGG